MLFRLAGPFYSFQKSGSVFTANIFSKALSRGTLLTPIQSFRRPRSSSAKICAFLAVLASTSFSPATAQQVARQGAAAQAAADICGARPSPDCLERAFREADRQNGELYRSLQASADDAGRIALRDAQRAWLRRRDDMCGFHSRESNYDAWIRELVQDRGRARCMIGVVEARVRELRVAAEKAPQRAAGGSDCAAEASALNRWAKTVRLEIGQASALKSGEALTVSWQASEGSRGRMPAYLALAVPGDVRFETAAVELRRDTYGVLLPELPGFLALPTATRAPLGIQFGADKTRALIPLHQPGSRLSGSFSVRIFDSGPHALSAALIARTQCGERQLTADLGRSIFVAPGDPEILVQDPYDIEVPKSVLVSNNGRYLAQIFDARYRVFDLATGVKLVDRNGFAPNFSPTSRFIVADVGDHDGRDFEVIDLISRDVIARPIGRYVGWTSGDAFLIDGRAEYGIVSLRPTLVSRQRKASIEAGKLGVSWAPELGAVGGEEDGLQIDYFGSCHACRSWTDTDLSIDLDHAVAVLNGVQGTPQIFELATGHSGCCQSPDAVPSYLSAHHGVDGFALRKGWRAGEPIAFTHVFDPLNYPGVKWWDATVEKEDWYQAALVLRKQLAAHRQINPEMQERLFADAANGTASRGGDWQERGWWKGLKQWWTGGTVARTVEDRLLTELDRFGIATMEAASPEEIPFANIGIRDDPLTRDRYGENSERIEAEITKRTQPVERRLVGAFPALKTYLSEEASALDFPGIEEKVENKAPPSTLTGKKFSLNKNLVGLWRWEIEGQALWLMQLLMIDGSSASGYGALVLLDGAKPPADAITFLTPALPDFWNGSYGQTTHQTRVKPQLFANGYLVAASVSSGTIAVYDVKRAQPKLIIPDIPQRDLLREVRLSADGRFVVQISTDGQFFLYELASGKRTLSGRFIDNEIIVYTPEGYYWSSYEGAHFVQLRFPGMPGLFSVAQFASALSRPEIVKARLAGTGPASAPQLAPPPALDMRIADAQDANNKGSQVLVDAGSAVGLARLRFYQDGLIVRDIPLSGTRFQERVAIPRLPHARRLTALATDVKGFISAARSIKLETSGERSNQLHAVIVGVDKYGGPDLDLRYARSDAERLAGALNAVNKRYYVGERADVLVDDAAKASAIIAALEKAVATAEPQDTIIFSFAGHGVQDKSGRYFLAPSGFQLTDIQKTGLAWSQLAAIFERAKARVVVILDSCHSGLSGSEGLATNDNAVSALLSGSRAPMLVFAASKGREFAHEDPKWDGGVFTYALTQILQDKTRGYDSDRDGVIELSELYRALREVVTRETAGRQNPWLVRQDLIGDFALF
jgi:uncharacterized protein YecT (DUF1311 family)